MISTDLLRGVYDLHTHPSPSHFPRLLNDFEILEQAEQVGMAGILLKNHYEPTGARAVTVNIQHKGYNARAYGSAVLNYPLGGLNPYAVCSALQMGAKVIFMPTRDADNSLKYGNMPGDFFSRDGISILNCNGQLKSEVYEIFDVVKKYDAVLATGHISAEESIIMCKAGRDRGVRIILTHPEWVRTTIDVATQRDLAKLGVYIEKCWLNIADGMCTAEQMAFHIRTVGAEHCFLSTDRGQAECESPVEGMEKFLLTLLDHGITKKEIKTMTHDIPTEILNAV